MKAGGSPSKLAAAKGGHDFVQVATPPRHGPNPRFIDAWNFDPGAIAPHEIRDFAFVLNDREYQRVLAALNRGADPGALRGGRGRVRLFDIRRTTGGDGRPAFVSISFNATVRVP